MLLYLVYFACGAIGSFTKDIIQDNKLKLPKFEEDSIFLGFIGGIVIGGVAGVLVDNSILTALLGGYVGSGVIEGLVDFKKRSQIT